MNPEPIIQQIEARFSSAIPSRCPFCGGAYNGDSCIMCARTTNILWEVKVMREQRKAHHNWHTYCSHWLDTGGIRGSRRYKSRRSTL